MEGLHSSQHILDMVRKIRADKEAGMSTYDLYTKYQGFENRYRSLYAKVVSGDLDDRMLSAILRIREPAMAGRATMDDANKESDLYSFKRWGPADLRAKFDELVAGGLSELEAMDRVRGGLRQDGETDDDLRERLGNMVADAAHEI